MKKIVIISLLLMLFTSCSSVIGSGQSETPYLIKGEMQVLDEGEKDLTSFNFVFKNCTSKDVFSFTVSFFLFDNEGNPASLGVPGISCIVRKDIPSGETLESSFSLDRFFSQIPEEPYKVEYLYVKKIIYSDGSEWNDPFGMKAL